MWTFTANELLPGVADEILSAKSETIWQSSQSFYYSKITEPYLFISSFCEHKKHKTSSSKINRISSPKTSISKSPNIIANQRKNIQSAMSSPNISLRSTGNTSKTPTRTSKLAKNTNLSLNADLLENDTMRSKSETNLIEKLPALEDKENNESEPNPLSEIQPIEMYDENLSEKWFLKCVCGTKVGDGNLICCDKCGYWQHCICFNYNSHTSPENYVCVFCEQKRIRCKCGNNLDYSFSIIQCSNCGYYVHKRCEGLNYGPMPTEGKFLCHFCGKSKIKYKFVNLPSKSTTSNSHSNTDSVYHFNSSKINLINTSIININSSPFKKLLLNKFSDKDISAKTFFETVYNKYRTFFYICHSLFTSTTSKKKRNRLLTSFLQSFEYLAYSFYGIMHEKFIELLDSLIFEDLYFKHDFSKGNNKQDEMFDLSENARLEIPNLLNNTNLILKLSAIPKNPPVRQTKTSGLMAMCDLYPDQFVLLVDGLLCDIEEFSYDPKVDSAYYQIAGTRFVLDATHVPSSPLHLMKRSIYGNCVLKLININDSIKCGLFISKNYITMNSNMNYNHLSTDSSTSDHSNTESTFTTRSVKNDFDKHIFNGVKSGTILTLGIDFLPAILEEKKVSKYLSWHCNTELEDKLNDIQMGITSDEAQEHNKDKYSDKDKDRDIYYYYNTKSRRSTEKDTNSKHTTNNRGKKSGKSSYSSSASHPNLTSYSQATLTSSSSMDNTSKKKRGRKMKKKNITLFTEFSLFSLFENEEAGEIMFNITEKIDDEEQPSESEDTQDTKTDDTDVNIQSRSYDEIDNNNDILVQNKSANDSIESMNELLNRNNSE